MRANLLRRLHEEVNGMLLCGVVQGLFTPSRPPLVS